jgi:hypothetical protein
MGFGMDLFRSELPVIYQGAGATSLLAPQQCGSATTLRDLSGVNGIATIAGATIVLLLDVVPELTAE